MSYTYLNSYQLTWTMQNNIRKNIEAKINQKLTDANYGEAAATLILQSFPNLELTTLL